VHLRHEMRAQLLQLSSDLRVDSYKNAVDTPGVVRWVNLTDERLYVAELLNWRVQELVLEPGQ
jgi:hypothetical protein